MENYDRSRVDTIKKVSIPKYFYEIIIPRMTYYYNDYTVDFDVSKVVKCPLHEENTPSFRWYEHTNSFACFGCRRGGDIINLHRYFMESINGKKPSFKEALDFLENYFIKGIGTVDVFVQDQIDQQEHKSTVSELIRLSNYIKDLEENLLRDIRIGMEKKIKLYNCIDNMQLLVSLNKVNAMEALRYLKQMGTTI